MDKKGEAYRFLFQLEEKLNSELPNPLAMKERLVRIIDEARKNPTKKHVKYKESAFLNTQLLPIFREHLKTIDGLSDDQIQRSLLWEYWHSIPGLGPGTVARIKPHPFSKALGQDPLKIMARWKGVGGKSPSVQPNPDFALRDPFPFNIVFEGKYSDSESPSTAGRVLVESIYEAFFYRSLPVIPPDAKGRGWDYEFSCLLAFDASASGALKSAWNAVAAPEDFWEGGNIYVMILRGNSSSIAQPEVQISEMITNAHSSPTHHSEELVTVHLPVTRETPLYLVTAPMGDRPRWFEKSRLSSYASDPLGGYIVTLPKQELASRNLLFLTSKEVIPRT
jgi:hypothetical protein